MSASGYASLAAAMAPPQIFQEVPFIYRKGYTPLNASQAIVGDATPLDTDGEFELRSLSATFTDILFQFRYQNANGVYLQNGLVNWGNYQGVQVANTGSMPYTVDPGVVYPPGGRIVNDITDTSAAPNTIQVAYEGVKRLIAGATACVPGV